MKLLLFLMPLTSIVSYFAGIYSHILWLRFVERKEQKIRYRVEKVALQEYSTDRIADELFQRPEAWDTISEQADRENNEARR